MLTTVPPVDEFTHYETRSSSDLGRRLVIIDQVTGERPAAWNPHYKGVDALRRTSDTDNRRNFELVVFTR